MRKDRKTAVNGERKIVKANNDDLRENLHFAEVGNLEN